MEHLVILKEIYPLRNGKPRGVIFGPPSLYIRMADIKPHINGEGAQLRIGITALCNLHLQQIHKLMIRLQFRTDSVVQLQKVSDVFSVCPFFESAVTLKLLAHRFDFSKFIYIVCVWIPKP